jgi:hypothetical protein
MGHYTGGISLPVTNSLTERATWSQVCTLAPSGHAHSETTSPIHLIKIEMARATIFPILALPSTFSETVKLNHLFTASLCPCGVVQFVLRFGFCLMVW